MHELAAQAAPPPDVQPLDPVEDRLFAASAAPRRDTSLVDAIGARALLRLLRGDPADVSHHRAGRDRNRGPRRFQRRPGRGRVASDRLRADPPRADFPRARRGADRTAPPERPPTGGSETGVRFGFGEGGHRRGVPIRPPRHRRGRFVRLRPQARGGIEGLEALPAPHPGPGGSELSFGHAEPCPASGTACVHAFPRLLAGSAPRQQNPFVFAVHDLQPKPGCVCLDQSASLAGEDPGQHQFASVPHEVR